MNSFGALAHSELDADLNDRQYIVEKLQGELLSTSNIEELGLFLSALANTGDEDVVPVAAARLFSHENPEIRLRAYRAFNRLGSPEAVEIFKGGLSSESNRRVRIGAARTVRAMVPSQSVLTFAQEMLGRDLEPQEIIPYIETVGFGLAENPELEESLREVLMVARDTNVRRAVYRYIGPVSGR